MWEQSKQLFLMQNRKRKFFFDFANLGKMIDLIAIMIDK